MTGKAIHWPTILWPHIQQLSSVVATSHARQFHMRFKTPYLLDGGIAALGGEQAPAALKADRGAGGVVFAADEEAQQVGAFAEPFNPGVALPAQQDEVGRRVDQGVTGAPGAAGLPVMHLFSDASAQFTDVVSTCAYLCAYWLTRAGVTAQRRFRAAVLASQHRQQRQPHVV